MNFFPHFLTGLALFSLATTPALAQGNATSTSKANPKKAAIECQKEALSKYLKVNDDAWNLYTHELERIQDAYREAMTKARQEKSKEQAKDALVTLKGSRQKAKDVWRRAHKVAKDTLQVDRTSCKKMR